MSHKHLFLALLLLDAIILVLHLLFGPAHTFFHLDFEQNLPTVYQSGKLIVFGLIFLYLNAQKKVDKELISFTLPLSLFIIFLGLDELLQIHENIYLVFELFDWLHPSRIVSISMGLGYRSSLWILYYLPAIFLFVFWSGYWMRYFQSKLRANFWIILVSSLSLLTVLLAEIASSTGDFSEVSYLWLITIEETAELLLGSTLILVGLKVFKLFQNKDSRN